MAVDLAEEYVSVAEAAQLLRVSRATIWRWIEQRRLPAYRVGARRVRLRRADLTSVVAPRKSAPPGKLTSERQAQAFAAIERFKHWQEIDRKRNGGVPWPSSWEAINEMRDERDRQLAGEAE